MRADQLSYALSNLPSLALPSVKGLSVLLGIYIVLVGPVNYGLLRWRKRLHWAWVSIPLITLIFAGGAFGLGYALRGTDLIMNEIALVCVQTDGTALVSSYMGLFSPAQQSYEIEVLSDGLLSSPGSGGYGRFGPGSNMAAGDVVFVQGNPGTLRGLAVNQWSMQAFMVETSWPDLGRVSSDLWFEKEALVGSVHNETDVTLQDAAVVLGTQFVRLGELAPGAKAEVRMDLSNGSDQVFGPPLSYRLFEEAFSRPGPNGPPREAQIKQQILDSLLNQNVEFSPVSSRAPMGSGLTQELMLLAWLDQSPPEVRVAGREPVQQTTALLFSPLTYSLAQEDTIAVPPGFVTGKISRMPLEGGMCGPAGTTAVYVGNGSAELEFQLPQETLDVQINEITLSVHSDGGWQQPDTIAVYDWDEETWIELAEAVLGDNVIAEPAGLVRGDGLLRARLFVTSRERGGCFYVGLGFRGTRQMDAR
jgi:hypothetical protein